MNCYDFDNTIFKGDSTARFIVFLVKNDLSLLKFFPRIAGKYIQYLFRRITKTDFKETIYSMFTAVPDMDAKVSAFWDINMNRIKSWYLEMKREDDIIISASPEFTVTPICERMGILCVMGSRVDKRTGLYTGKNCDGEEKVRRFYERFPDATIQQFYSDSMDDAPLAGIAEKAFMVKGDKLLPWPGKNNS